MEINQNLYKDKDGDLYLVDNRLNYGICVYTKKSAPHLFIAQKKQFLNKTNNKLKIKINSWNLCINNRRKIIMDDGVSKEIDRTGTFIFHLLGKIYLHQKGSDRVTIVSLSDYNQVSFKRIFLSELNSKLKKVLKPGVPTSGRRDYYFDENHKVRLPEKQVEIKPLAVREFI